MMLHSKKPINNKLITLFKVWAKVVQQKNCLAFLGGLLFSVSACSTHECDRAKELCDSYLTNLQLPIDTYLEKQNQTRESFLFTINHASPRSNLHAQLIQGDKKTELVVTQMNQIDSSITYQATGDISVFDLGDAQFVVYDEEQPLVNPPQEPWPQIHIVYRKVEFSSHPTTTFVDQSLNPECPHPIWLAIRQGIIYSQQTGYYNVPINKIKTYLYYQDSTSLKQLSESSFVSGDSRRLALLHSTTFSLFPDPTTPNPTFSTLYGCSVDDSSLLQDLSCMTPKGKIPDGKITKPLAADKDGRFMALIDHNSLLKVYRIPDSSGMSELMPTTILNDPMSSQKIRAVIALDLNQEPSLPMPLRSDLLVIKEDGAVETYLQTGNAAPTLTFDLSIATKESAITGAKSLETLLYSSTEPPIDVLTSSDIDGDGTDDIAVVRGAKITILLNQSYQGYKRLPLDIIAPWAVDAIALGDINQDGKADIVVANTQEKSIAVYLSK